MNNDLYSLLFLLVVLIFFIYLFIRMAISIRKSGGSMLTTMHAATYDFLDKDKRKSVKEVIERKANKILDEEFSDRSKDDL